MRLLIRTCANSSVSDYRFPRYESTSGSASVPFPGRPLASFGLRPTRPASSWSCAATPCATSRFTIRASIPGHFRSASWSYAKTHHKPDGFIVRVRRRRLGRLLFLELQLSEAVASELIFLQRQRALAAL